MCEWSLGLELLQKQSNEVWVLLCLGTGCTGMISQLQLRNRIMVDMHRSEGYC